MSLNAAPRQSSSPSHVFLNDQEVAAFRSCDTRIVPSSRFPADFVSLAPQALDVGDLGPADVVRFCSASMSLPDAERVRWMHAFWTWMASWSQREQAFDGLKFLPILPEEGGNFAQLSSALFDTTRVDDRLRAILSHFGLRFLDHTFPDAPRALLTQRGVVKDPGDVALLLLHLQAQRSQGVDNLDIIALAQHIMRCLASSLTSLTNLQRNSLRQLPIFPVLSPFTSPDTSQKHPMFTNVTSRSKLLIFDVDQAHILKEKGTNLLPVLSNVTFIARRHAAIEFSMLVSKADPSTTNVIAELDVISRAVSNLPTQRKIFQVAFLRKIASHSHQLCSELLESLQKTAFVPSHTGQLIAPQDVVDPKTDIASLFSKEDSRFPRLLGPDDCHIVDSLRTLRLLRTTLTDEIIRDRLDVIERSPLLMRSCAEKLLKYLDHSRYNCSNLRSELGRCWLPTDKGLKKPSDCRDGSANRALFDHVLGVLDVVTEVKSPSLRVALRWDIPLPLNVIQDQLSRILESKKDDTFNRCFVILAELGCRVKELTPEVIECLRDITACHQWIPTTDSSLCIPSRVLLTEERPLPGFCKVHSQLLLLEGVREVLSQMGCLERCDICEMRDHVLVA